MSDMKDFKIRKCELIKYVGSGGDVVIPDSIVSIGAHAFEYCANITSITIPNSVKSIGDTAFCRCKNLEKVILPNELQRIGYNSFAFCEKLSTINLDSVDNVKIDKCAFLECNKLVDENGLFIYQNRLLLARSGNGSDYKYYIPDTIDYIEDKAFNGFTKYDIQMNIKCPVWETHGEAKVYGFAESIIKKDGSTITFRNDDGKIVAKVVLAIDDETEPKCNRAILTIRQENRCFDFAGYDANWVKMGKKTNKILIALTRFLYPYSLTDEMRNIYFTFLQKNSVQAGTLLIDDDNIEGLKTLLTQQVFTAATIQLLIDYATTNSKAEAAALLLANVSTAPIKKKTVKKQI